MTAYFVVEFHNSEFPIDHFRFDDLDKATRKRNKLNNLLKLYGLYSATNWCYGIEKREV